MHFSAPHERKKEYKRTRSPEAPSRILDAFSTLSTSRSLVFDRSGCLSSKFDRSFCTLGSLTYRAAMAEPFRVVFGPARTRRDERRDGRRRHLAQFESILQNCERRVVVILIVVTRTIFA
jgi:hypothetical protein